MQPITTIPVFYLLGPIAASTVLTAFLFAGAWRAYQIERRLGRDPWWGTVGLALYIGATLYFLYRTNKNPAFSLFDVFAIAMLGQAWGVLTVGALVQAFITTRGKALKGRAFPMLAGMLFLAGMIGAMFSQLPK